VRPVFVGCLLAGGVYAQAPRPGLKIGVPATRYFDTGRSVSLHGSSDYSAATRRYTAGASAEWGLSRRLGLELDVLYHRMGYVGIVSTFDSARGVLTTSALDAKGHSWDFPLLAKYRFGRVVRPFVAAGGVLRYVGPVRARGEVTVQDLITRTTVRAPLDTRDPSDLRKRLYPGLALAAGVEFGAGGLRLLSDVRYTRWTANIGGPGGVLRFHPGQAEVLLGVSF
jgi:hypothetical protein